MKKFIQKLSIITAGIVGILILAIIIPNIIVWKNGGRKPVPQGQIIVHDDQRHLLIIDEKGDVVPFLQQEDGSYRKIKLR